MSDVEVVPCFVEYMCTDNTQAAERGEKFEAEAASMESQYTSAYGGARQTYSEGRARLDAIQAVRTIRGPCPFHC